MTHPRFCRPHWLALAALAAPLAAAAQDTASRITSVTLYPGSATVERSLSLPAGARQVTIACLPAALDVSSLRALADNGIRVGDISAQPQTREQAGARCADNPLQARIRSVEEQLASVQAERTGLETAAAYLQSFGNARPETARAAGPQLGATVQALRQQSRDLALQNARLNPQIEALKAELAQLHAERDRSGTQDASARVYHLRIALDAPRGGNLRLSYQVRGPSWQPGYRATLDTRNNTVRLERQALVVQNTGEDWNAVSLVLSTGRPGSASSGRLPGDWRVDIAPPVVHAVPPAPPAPAMAAVSRQALAAKSAEVEDRAAPALGVSAADTGYASEFTVAQPITVPTGGQSVSLALDEYRADAKVRTRTAPMQETAAYLVADIAPPPGVWPAGRLSLYRDGAYVGAGHFAPETLASQGLAFGRDERVRVRVEPPEQHSGSGGFISSQNERRDTRRFVVENRHNSSIALQVLDAAPISQNEQVRVQSSYQPEPATTRWDNRPGLVEWALTLPAGASQRFEAQHRISWPEDARLRERRQ